MSAIELSAGFVQPMISRILRNTDSQVNNTNYIYTSGLLPGGLSVPAYGYTYCQSQIMLMKGAVPTVYANSTIFPRKADILVRFRHSASLEWNTYSNVSANPISLTSQFTPANASGVVTWFWWVVSDANAGVVDDIDKCTNLQQIIGTVGLAGSGADLELPDTNIVNGQQYRIANLKLQFPTNWIY
jgi:hypothetical protein